MRILPCRAPQQHEEFAFLPCKKKKRLSRTKSALKMTSWSFNLHSFCAGAFSLAIFSALVLAGCSPRRAGQDADTVNFLIESMPVNLDPRIGTDAQSEYIDSLLFDN